MIQTLLPISENFYLTSDNQRIYFASSYGIRLVNTQNYQDICTSLTPTNLGNSYIAVLNDENNIISASPYGALMNVKNCYFNTEVPKINVKNDTLIIPNPVNDIINLNLSDDINGIYNFLIYSINGSLISNNSINLLNGSGSINVSQLNNGSYILTLNNSNHYFTFKFVIER